MRHINSSMRRTKLKQSRCKCLLNRPDPALKTCFIQYLGSVTSIYSCIGRSTTVAASFFSVGFSIPAVRRVTRESVPCTLSKVRIRQSIPKILHIGYSRGTDCSNFEPWECRYNRPWIKTAPLDLCHRFEGIYLRATRESTHEICLEIWIRSIEWTLTARA